MSDSVLTVVADPTPRSLTITDEGPTALSGQNNQPVVLEVASGEGTQLVVTMPGVSSGATWTQVSW